MPPQPYLFLFRPSVVTLIADIEEEENGYYLRWTAAYGGFAVV